MTIHEMYDEIQGDYDDAILRFQADALIERFALKFIDDKSFAELDAAMAAGDAETAFRAAHTLKGVAKNLAFKKLGDSSSRITELLRNGDMADAAEMMSEIRSDYELVINGINRLKK